MDATTKKTFMARAPARVDPAGGGGASDPFDLTTYGEAEVGDLASDIYADMSPDGTLDSLTLIDARTAAYFSGGHIPGALNVLYDDLLAEGADATPSPKDRFVVFYCYGGT